MSDHANQQALKEVSKSIQASYEELSALIGQIGDVKEAIQSINASSEEIRVKYSEALDNNKLTETKDEFQKIVRNMEQSLDGIEEKIKRVVALRRIAADNLEDTIKRVNKFEDTLNKLNSKSKKLNDDLKKKTESLNHTHESIEKKTNRTMQMIDLNYHADKYDEILELQKKNNKLLKELKAEKSSNIQNGL